MVRLLTAAMVIGALIVSPIDAVASTRDETAARIALTAGYSALKQVIRTWPKLEASLSRLNERFAAECPDVGGRAPQTEAEQRMSYEVAGALWATGYHADAPIIRKFIHAIIGLATSNPAINRRMHKFVKGLKEMVALSVPDICADVRAWTASGYQTIPATTLRFDRHVEAIDVEIPSPKLAEPYLTPSDRNLIPKLERLMTQFEELEIGTGQRYWDMLLETLSVPQ